LRALDYRLINCVSTTLNDFAMTLRLPASGRAGAQGRFHHPPLPLTFSRTHASLSEKLASPDDEILAHFRLVSTPGPGTIEQKSPSRRPVFQWAIPLTFTSYRR
jgi:hypothetical protein